MIDCRAVARLPQAGTGASDSGQTGHVHLAWGQGPHRDPAPVCDLQRACEWYSHKLGLDPVEAREGGNYPSKGTGELAAWFKDCDDNMLGIGESLP